MQFEMDTIAAIATAPGDGGIAVIRVSGDAAPDVLKRCFRRKASGAYEHAKMYYGHVVDEAGNAVDEAMAILFYAPRSYTREHVFEIQCHGGAAQARRVLGSVLKSGARPAHPGEFTRRAFLNGRIDLSRAEAVMALISAGSDAAARAAVSQLGGGVSAVTQAMADRLTDMLSLIEAGNDFPEEVDEQATSRDVIFGIDEISGQLTRISDARAARVLREGLCVALVGRPNTGKSSLMNRLLGTDRAIVTEHPGTTRDLVSENMSVGGYRVTLIDTAGQRDAADEVERIGVERAKGAQRSADLVLLVVDGSQPLTDEDRSLMAAADRRTRVVVSKCDLASALDKPLVEAHNPIRVSSLTGEGIDQVLAEIVRSAGQPGAIDGQLTVERHLELAGRALKSLKSAREALEGDVPIDVCAVDLMEALESLNEVTGTNATESVIDRVFASFCVGK